MVLKDVHEQLNVRGDTTLSYDQLRETVAKMFRADSGMGESHYFMGNKVCFVSGQTSNMTMSERAKFIQWIIMNFSSFGIVFHSLGDFKSYRGQYGDN